MITEYLRPSSASEAKSLVSGAKIAPGEPGILYIAGGTQILARGRESVAHAEGEGGAVRLVSLENILPRTARIEIGAGGKVLVLGAGMSFQDLLDEPGVPGSLRKAASTMADRKIRIRATLGGNIASDASCSSLLPLFIVLDARYRLEGGEEVDTSAWRNRNASGRAGSPLILEVAFPLDSGVPGEAAYSAFTRYSRTSCDLSVLTCAASCRISDGFLVPGSLKVALGGLDACARRFEDMEKALEIRIGSRQAASVPSAEIEETAGRFFNPIDDARGSAAFKRSVAGTLVADALRGLEALA